MAVMCDSEDEFTDDILLAASFQYESMSLNSSEFTDSIPDSVLFEASINFESSGGVEKCSRFAAPVTDGELDSLVPRNTTKQTSWTLGVWTAWCRNQSEVTGEAVPELMAMTKEEHNKWIGKFLVEVR